MKNPPEVGQLAVVRCRPYVVNEVLGQGIKSSIIEESHADYLVKLSSVEDDSPGEELEVIWGLEPSATVQESSSLPEVKEFDNPKILDAFLDAVRWGAVSQADEKALQSPFRSGIEIDDYQPAAAPTPSTLFALWQYALSPHILNTSSFSKLFPPSLSQNVL